MNSESAISRLGHRGPISSFAHMEGRDGHVARPFTAVLAASAMPVATAVSQSSATATATEDTTVFVAALQGDLETIQPLLPHFS